MNLGRIALIAGKRNKRGFTLVETMVVMGLAGIVLAIIMATYNYSGTSFSAMGNYTELDRKSRAALDLLSREIRNSSALIGVTNSPKALTFYNGTTGKRVTITYDSANKLLKFDKTGQATQILLTSCDQWDYALYGRVPTPTSSNITFNAVTDITACKLVNMTWKCSRTIFGSKRNTETIQTAQIVLRNKVN
jgi:prepilin-type N-terminal cleavage/methylation domain-containing protein